MQRAGPSGSPASLLDRVLDPGAARPLRLAAARGALPLDRGDLVLALVRLSTDAETEIAAEAAKTLAGTPEEVLREVAGNPSTPAEVLDCLARRPGAGVDLLSALIVHPATSDESLLHLADSKEPAILDRLVANEARLARNPAIAGRVKANPALSRDSRRRILELEQHVLGGEEIRMSEPAVEAPETAGPTAEELRALEEAAAAESPAAMLEIPLTPEEQAAEEALRRTPLFQRVVRMTVAEKIQTAVKGNAEERAILIRDPSRIVATTVLKSPKVSDKEVENFANLRNINDEVLRIIGNSREWTKSYPVAFALSRNPRTPTGISLTMLNRLTLRDLKGLGNDKNIPEVIRRSAKRLYDLRSQPVEKGKRK
jgi:hypothetical protein